MNEKGNESFVQRCPIKAKLYIVDQGGQKRHLLISALAASMEWTIDYRSMNIQLVCFVLCAEIT